jgi:hypothetical protein
MKIWYKRHRDQAVAVIVSFIRSTQARLAVTATSWACVILRRFINRHIERIREKLRRRHLIEAIRDNTINDIINSTVYAMVKTHESSIARQTKPAMVVDDNEANSFFVTAPSTYASHRRTSCISHVSDDEASSQSDLSKQHRRLSQLGLPSMIEVSTLQTKPHPNSSKAAKQISSVLPVSSNREKKASLPSVNIKRTVAQPNASSKSNPSTSRPQPSISSSSAATAANKEKLVPAKMARHASLPLTAIEASIYPSINSGHPFEHKSASVPIIESETWTEEEEAKDEAVRPVLDRDESRRSSLLNSSEADDQEASESLEIESSGRFSKPIIVNELKDDVHAANLSKPKLVSCTVAFNTHQSKPTRKAVVNTTIAKPAKPTIAAQPVIETKKAVVVVSQPSSAIPAVKAQLAKERKAALAPKDPASSVPIAKPHVPKFQRPKETVTTATAESKEEAIAVQSSPQRKEIIIAKSDEDASIMKIQLQRIRSSSAPRHRRNPSPPKPIQMKRHSVDHFSQISAETSHTQSSYPKSETKQIEIAVSTPTSKLVKQEAHSSHKPVVAVDKLSITSRKDPLSKQQTKSTSSSSSAALKQDPAPKKDLLSSIHQASASSSSSSAKAPALNHGSSAVTTMKPHAADSSNQRSSSPSSKPRTIISNASKHQGSSSTPASSQAALVKSQPPPPHPLERNPSTISTIEAKDSANKIIESIKHPPASSSSTVHQPSKTLVIDMQTNADLAKKLEEELQRKRKHDAAIAAIHRRLHERQKKLQAEKHQQELEEAAKHQQKELVSKLASISLSRTVTYTSKR